MMKQPSSPRVEQTPRRRKPSFLRNCIALVAASAVCLAFALVLPSLAMRFPAVVERVYSSAVFPAVSVLFTQLIGLLPVSIAELLLYTLVLTAVALLVWGVALLLRGQWKRVVLGALTLCLIASAMFARFYVAWGFQYFRPPVSTRLPLTVKNRSAQELADLCVSLAKQAAAQRASLSENADGTANVGSPGDALSSVSAEYKALHQKYPTLSPFVARPKAVLASQSMSVMGISGIYIPFTFESNVNVDQPTLLLPVTAAHEAAHQTGIAREDEANFIGYLACITTDDTRLHYSGTMLALIHAGNALNSVNPEAYATLVRKYYSQGMRRDFTAHNAYWKKFEGPVADHVEKTNDRYLKSNGQADGVASYGRMVDLLLAAREAGIIP